MACMGSSSEQKSTTTIQPAPATFQETQATNMQNLINELQAKESGWHITQPGGFDPAKYLAANPDVAADPFFGKNPLEHWTRWGQAEGRPGGPTPGSVEAIPLSEQSPEAQQEAAINQKIRDYVLGQIDQTTNGPSAETRKLVGDIYGAQQTKGEQEISRYIGSEAAARGLNLSDTPILRELGLATTDLQTGLRGAEASSLLNVGQANQTFAANLATFQANLRNQAYLNRLNLGSSYGTMATNLASLRYGAGTRTTTSTGASGSAGNTMMGAGGLMQGAGGLLSMFGGSGGGAGASAGTSFSMPDAGQGFASVPFMS